jgi:hypothetical protein
MSSMVPCALAFLLALGQFGHSNTGELRLSITDSGGLPLPGPVEVVSDANEFRQRIESVRYERDVTASSRFGVILRHGDARFLVPNERVQQEAGQRQDRSSTETAAQFSAQRIFSPTLVGDVRAMVRDCVRAILVQCRVDADCRVTGSWIPRALPEGGRLGAYRCARAQDRR